MNAISAHDVAAYILARQGSMTTMKLQKLLYYCQAWSLVWDDRPMFPEAIEAWANGPVVREVFNRHRAVYEVSTWPTGNADALDEDAVATVDAVLKHYGDKSGFWLSQLTHAEDPWKDARRGLAPGDRCTKHISLESMSEYYSSLG